MCSPHSPEKINRILLSWRRKSGEKKINERVGGDETDNLISASGERQLYPHTKT